MNKLFLALLLFFLCAGIFSEEIRIGPGNADSLLIDSVIISGTLRVSEEGNVLENGRDYFFSEGKIVFHKEHDSLLVQFEYAEKGVLRLNRLYEKRAYSKEREADEGKSGKNEEIYIRGGNGIIIGASGASGVELEQTLDISVEGVVSDRWRVRGSVYDNSGISQSGTVNLPITQLENISISVFDSLNSFKLGNQTFKGPAGRFTGMSREIIGLSYAYTGPENTAGISAASQKGKVRSVRIQLLNDVWGPYPLTDEQTLYDYVISPGSENIYLNGVLLTEGYDYDYTLDYRTGEITLTNRVDVDSTKYLYAEFQTYEYFSPLTGYYSFGSIGDSRLEYVFLREEQNISDKDVIDQLKYASSDTSYIISSGEIYRGEGEGDYIKTDSIFVYAGADEGVYDVEFVYVGYGKGSYIYSPVINAYVYSGEGAGYYLPYRKIDLPFESNYAGMHVEQKAGPGVITAGAGGGFYSYNRYAAEKKYIKDISFEAGYSTDIFRINKFSFSASAGFVDRSPFFSEVWSSKDASDLSFSDNVGSAGGSGKETGFKANASYEDAASLKFALSYIDSFIQKSIHAESDTLWGFFSDISGKNITRGDSSVYEKRNASLYRIIGSAVGGGYAESELLRGIRYLRKAAVIRNLTSSLRASYRNEKGIRDTVQISDQNRYSLSADIGGFTTAAEYRETDDLQTGVSKNLLIGDAGFSGALAKIFSVKSGLSVTSLSSYKTTDVYIYAGKGKGDYIYDDESGLYIEDQYEGEYVKTVQTLPSATPLSNRSANLTLAAAGGGFNFSLIGEYSDAAENVASMSSASIQEKDYRMSFNFDYGFNSGISPYASADIVHNGKVENYESDEKVFKAGVLSNREDISFNIYIQESDEARDISSYGYEDFTARKASININPASKSLEYDITVNAEKFWALYSYGGGEQSLSILKMELIPSLSFIPVKSFKIGAAPSVAVNTYSGNDNPPLSIYYRYPSGLSYSGYAYALYTLNSVSISLRYTSELNGRFGYRQKAEVSVYTYF